MNDHIDPAIVEKTAQHIYQASPGYALTGNKPWHDLTDRSRENARRSARAALEAAAPLIATKALREAAEVIPSVYLRGSTPAHWLGKRADQIAGVDQYEQAWQSRDWDTVRHLQDEQGAEQ